MSKRRNNRLRKALELVCQHMRELNKYSAHTKQWGPEYWYALACSNKLPPKGQQDENLSGLS